MAVSAGQSDREGCSGGVGDQVVLGAWFCAVDRAGPDVVPPLSARRCDPSTRAMDSSSFSAARSSVSTCWCSCCHTPTSCHSASRRQHVAPEAPNNAVGNWFQPIPDRATNKRALTLGDGHVWSCSQTKGSEKIYPMSKKNYTEEFRRDAVALYRDTVGATVAGIATDLGISHGSLTAWLKSPGVPIRKPRRTSVPEATGDETPEQEPARLRAELTQVKAERAKLETERDILRSAAKNCAGETNW